MTYHYQKGVTPSATRELERFYIIVKENRVKKINMKSRTQEPIFHDCENHGLWARLDFSVPGQLQGHSVTFTSSVQIVCHMSYDESLVTVSHCCKDSMI